MQSTSTEMIDGQVIWHDTQILSKIDPLLFDLDWHRRQGEVLGGAPGRGRAHFLRIGGRELVLRPFRRGGLVGKINADLYLRLGATASRAFREYVLLGWMRDHNLPVPRPVAARYTPYAMYYRADLITERIPDARPLADIVLEEALTLETWTEIGAVIRQMHDLGVDHSDLNCRNILIDVNMQVWLIDFDKCRRRAAGGWRARNLARLKRSLVKERTKHPSLFWSDADWAAVMAGYNACDL
ncbi:MAG: 3-deoxy-D-manno-octulosonic acid kinase [Rhodobacteraceae bacterium]|nr:3-deoxy-D-manno-octulosonic acid kinase [Paracoccaceae bacterium]